MPTVDVGLIFPSDWRSNKIRIHIIFNYLFVIKFWKSWVQQAMFHFVSSMKNYIILCQLLCIILHTMTQKSEFTLTEYLIIWQKFWFLVFEYTLRYCRGKFLFSKTKIFGLLKNPKFPRIVKKIITFLMSWIINLNTLLVNCFSYADVFCVVEAFSLYLKKFHHHLYH